MSTDHRYSRFFALALAVFAIAALTGFAYRYAVLHGSPGGLSVANIRHAHSHLMYMGWATPALFGLMAAQLPRLGARRFPRAGWWALLVSVVLAALCYPAFLAWGYAPTHILGARIPVAAALSGLVMLAWYGVAGAYAWATRGVPRTLALRAWDIGLALMAIATVGAWAQAAAVISPLSPALRVASLHLFLDLFGGGWFVFGLIALVADRMPGLDRADVRVAVWLLAASVPFTFLLAVPEDLLSARGVVLRHVAAALAGLALAWIGQAALRIARRAAPELVFSLVALLLYAASLTAATYPAILEAAMQSGLRLVYLHVLFLGALSTGLFAVASRAWGLEGRSAFNLAAFAVIGSLLPLTWLWPEAWSGLWRLQFAEIAAIGPVLVVVYVLFRTHITRGLAATMSQPGAAAGR